MAIPVKCTHCGRSFEASNEQAGQRVRCSCGQPVAVGRPDDAGDFFSQELNLNKDPLLAENVDDWAKATGASPEVAEQIQKRMAPKATGNAGLMMAVTGAVLALLLIIALFAWLLAAR